MKLSGQTVALLLSQDGQEVLRQASVSFPSTGLVTVLVEESEDLGIWIRIAREDQVHLILVRWDYILTVDLPSGMGRVVGMRR